METHIESPQPDDQSDSDSEYDEAKDEQEQDEDHLLKEMISIAKSEDYVGSLAQVEVIFSRIKTLENVKLWHNLIQLSLIYTQTTSIEGIQACGHSLEILSWIGCGLELMEDCLMYCTNLRELNMGENNLPCIQNLENCLHLEKLFLYSNKISTINGLANNKKLKELYLQDNMISKVSNCIKLSNLQVLLLSGNRIKNLNDLKEIEHLTLLKKLSFAWEDFAPWPVAEISGYRQYVLSICSKYLQTLDSEFLTDDDMNYAKNEFIECVLELQKSLEEVEKTHRHSVLTIDSKLRENEQHLEEIEDTLVDELNNLRQEIEDGKSKLLTEFEKLKKLRNKSEEVFLKSLKEIEEKYLIFDQVLNTEEEKFKDWDNWLEKSIKSVEFERDVYLGLVDVLYTSKGKVVYSNIPNSSAEFGYLSSIIDRGTKSTIRPELKKAFHVNFSGIDYNDSNMGQRLYISLPLKEMKDFLTSRVLPPLDSWSYDDNFPGNIQLSEGSMLLMTVKSEKKLNYKDNPVLQNWVEKKYELIFIEFVLVITWLSASDSIVFQDMNEDERIVEVISDCYNLPTESVAMIK